MIANTASATETVPGRTDLLRQHLVVPAAIILALALVGCSEEDCLNCVELPAPVVPTGVHSISGDNEVIVQWYDISYSPYDGQYNENVVGYRIYSRYFTEGDQNDPDREFGSIGYVEWDENFDGTSGLHWFYDLDAVNGERYEYAVASVNAAGRESALSYEFVIDAPLPMGLTELFDATVTADLAGFDFSALENGRMNSDTQGSTADIRVVFEGNVPYVESVRPQEVRILDAGVHTWVDDEGGIHFDFEGVSWAPWDGWSLTGRLELVAGHIYVVEIIEPNGDPQTDGPLHYAKFGVESVNVANPPTRFIRMPWAFQTIVGLPELSVPDPTGAVSPQPVVMQF